MVNLDVILNKSAIIERCVMRIEDEYANDPSNLKNYTKQDSMILNIQRACEASIDLAMHVVTSKKLGLPKSSREAFKLLEEATILDKVLAKNLMNMIGFRNIAVHDYQNVDTAILQAIIEKHLSDFTNFTNVILKLKE